MRNLLTTSIALAVLTSCAHHFVDPSCIGEVAGDESRYWEPTYTRLIPTPKPVDVCMPCDGDELTVSQMIDIALQNNPLTERSWATARAAAFNWRASESQYYPYITSSEAYSFTDAKTVVRRNAVTPGDGSAIAGGNNFLGNGYFEIWTQNLTMSYLLMDFGGRDATVSAAQQALFAANWTHNQTIQDVMITVLTDYYNYLLNKALLKANEEDLRTAKVNLEAAEARFEGGLATIVDVFQARSNVYSTELRLETTRGNVKIAMGDLAISMGLPPMTFFKIKDLPDVVAVQHITDNVEVLLEDAKMYRADLAAREATYRQAYDNWIVTKSAALPTISANQTFEGERFYKSPIDHSHSYATVLQIDIPLFQGFFYLNQIRLANEQMQEALSDWKVQEQVVMQNVITSYFNYKTAEENLKTAEEYLKYSLEAYTASYESYRAGVASFLDVLTTQVTLANARAQNIQAKANYVITLSNLAYATGVLKVTDEVADIMSEKNTSPESELSKKEEADKSSQAKDGHQSSGHKATSAIESVAKECQQRQAKDHP